MRPTLESLGEQREQSKVDGHARYFLALHGQSEDVVSVRSRCVVVDTSIEFGKAESRQVRWTDLSACPRLVSGVGPERSSHGGRGVRRVGVVQGKHVDRESVLSRRHVEAPPSVVDETHFAGGVWRDHHLQRGRERPRQGPGAVENQRNVAKRCPAVDNRAVWHNGVLSRIQRGPCVETASDTRESPDLQTPAHPGTPCCATAPHRYHRHLSAELISTR